WPRRPLVRRLADLEVDDAPLVGPAEVPIDVLAVRIPGLAVLGELDFAGDDALNDHRLESGLVDLVEPDHRVLFRGRAGHGVRRRLALSLALVLVGMFLHPAGARAASRLLPPRTGCRQLAAA